MTRQAWGLSLAFALATTGCLGPPGEQEQREVSVIEMDEDGLEVVEVQAADDEPPPPEPILEEEAVEIIGRMAVVLRTAKRFTFHVESTDERFLANGQTIELSATGDVKVRRPNGLLVDRTNDRSHRRFYYDGKSVALHDVEKGLYATNDDNIPGTIIETLDRLEERLGITIPLGDLVVGEPGKSLTDYADSGIYVGVNRVRGVACHHLAFANDFIEWQVWVQAEGDPVPLKFSIIYLDEPGEPRYRAHMSNWNLNAGFDDSAFAFTPPADAKRIEIKPVDTNESEE